VKKLPYQDEEFDLIYHCDVIGHITDTYTFLLENIRILKKGGLLYIKTPNAVSFRRRMNLLRGKHPYVNLKHVFNKHLKSSFYGCHLREYTLNELAYMVSQIGFNIKEMVHITYNPRKKLISRLMPSLSPIIVIVAQK